MRFTVSEIASKDFELLILYSVLLGWVILGGIWWTWIKKEKPYVDHVSRGWLLDNVYQRDGDKG